MRVVIVNTSDEGGGAEAVARSLHEGLVRRRHDSVFAVGHMDAESAEGEFQIPNWRHRRKSARFLIAKAARLEGRESSLHTRLAAATRWLAEPVRDSRMRLGMEDFDHPGTKHLLEVAPFTPDLIHLHNLHGGYFDLRFLADLSRAAPTALTLHDQWMLTGHCAYSLECERWRDECGSCPHLDVYPAVPRDATRLNLQRKAKIYAQSRLYISAPSRWLLKQVPQSVLSKATVDLRHIPNGVDQRVFRPDNRNAARRRLGLRLDAPILLFVANFSLTSPYKDTATLEKALGILGHSTQSGIEGYAIGEEGRSRPYGTVSLRYLPRIDHPETMASWYQAADLYVHAARAENSPLTILEALSCGTPVVATATGGIPEQVTPLSHETIAVPGGVGPDAASGMIVSIGDSLAMAEACRYLLSRNSLRKRLGENAARWARHKASLDLFVDNTLSWYQDILKWARRSPHGALRPGDEGGMG